MLRITKHMLRITKKINKSQALSQEKSSQIKSKIPKKKFPTSSQFFNLPCLGRHLKETLSRIHFLSKRTGYCFASDDYFAEAFNITSRAVRKRMKQLKDLGLIQINSYNKKARQIKIDFNMVQKYKKFRSEFLSEFLSDPPHFQRQNAPPSVVSSFSYEKDSGERGTSRSAPSHISFAKKDRAKTQKIGLSEEQLEIIQTEYPQLDVSKVFAKMLKYCHDHDMTYRNEVVALRRWCAREWLPKKPKADENAEQNKDFALKCMEAYKQGGQFTKTQWFEIYNGYVEFPTKSLSFKEYPPHVFKDVMKQNIGMLRLPT